MLSQNSIAPGIYSPLTRHFFHDSIMTGTIRQLSTSYCVIEDGKFALTNYHHGLHTLHMQGEMLGCTKQNTA